MNYKLTTPISILIGSFMIAGTILYTSGNISNPIIGTAHASGHDTRMVYRLDRIISLLKPMQGALLDIRFFTREISEINTDIFEKK